MPGKFKIETRDHVVRVTFERQSVITPELVIRAVDRENELHEIQGRYDLWDFRGCQPSDDFGYDAVTRIIEHIENHYENVWSIKTAMLVEEAIQYGLSRMFQILIDEFPTRVTIFQDEAAAMKWLGSGNQPEKDNP